MSVGKTERALKSISVAARSNGLPVPTHIPTEDSAKTEAVTNTGILGLMSHRTLFIRLIIMSLEWIGTSIVSTETQCSYIDLFSDHDVLLWAEF